MSVQPSSFASPLPPPSSNGKPPHYSRHVGDLPSGQQSPPACQEGASSMGQSILHLSPVALDAAGAQTFVRPRPPAPAADATIQAQEESEAAADVRQAREIRARTEAEETLARARLEAIRAETQTEIIKIWQEVLIRRQKVMADLFDKWWRVMFS